MIRRAIAGRGYQVLVAALAFAICLVGGFLLLVAVPDLAGLRSAEASSPSPVASPSPTPGSAMARSPIAIAIPVDSDCGACHVTSAGAVGVKPIPPMAHPLLGFRDCTACHNPTGLVKTAPGHSSLHKDDCLVCHQAPSGTSPSASVAPMRPEHMGYTQPCTSCHGVDQHAPLPADMQGRGDNCWICHNGPEFQYLFQSPGASPAPTPEPSGVRLGALALPEVTIAP